MLKLRKTQDGATAVEYAIIGALLSVVIVVAVAALGVSVKDLFGRTNDGLEEVNQYVEDYPS